MALSTSPALAHDTACSVLRPPNTTATLVFRSPTRCTSVPTGPPMVVPARRRPGCNAISRSTKCDNSNRRPRGGVRVQLPAAQGLQRHVGVGDQVLRVFQADREAHGARVDPG